MVCREKKGFPDKFLCASQQPSFISLLFLFTKKLRMAKKEWRLVPESELTEEEVRRWFNRLRELYQEEKNRVHEMKVERGKMRLEKERLIHEITVLTKRNKYLEGLVEKKQKEKTEKADFKKKFLDSL